MNVKVKLYATLQHYAGNRKAGIPMDVELQPGARLHELLEVLGIPAKEAHITFVNGIIEGLDRELREGDEIGMFPPIGGG